MRSFPFALLLGALLCGCTSEAPAEAPGIGCSGASPSTLDDVYNQWLSQSVPTGCASAGCHGTGAGGLTFASASELWSAAVNVDAKTVPGSKLIAPGDPAQSVLYQRLLSNAVGRMPQGGPYLDDGALEQVRGWICAGASKPSGGAPADAGPSFGLFSLSPTSIPVGSSNTTVRLIGAGFSASSQVRFDGSPLTQTFISSTELQVTLDAALLFTAGTHALGVTENSATSATLNLLVENPIPTLSSVSPTPVATNGAAFTLTLTGTQFNTSSQAHWDGSNVPSTLVSATRLLISVPSLSSARDYPVFVSNAGPGGGSSATLMLTAARLTGPSLTGLAPNPAGANATFTLTLSGAGFSCAGTATQVLLNGSTLSPSSCSSTQLTVAAPALAVGSYDVQARNPNTGDVSNVLSLSAVAPNPLPVLTALTPNSAASGAAGFTLVANGSAFVSGAQLYFNGVAKPTTFVSATQLQAPVLAADVASAGSFPVTVRNPAPGGGTSSAVAFTVQQSNPVPALTGSSPCGRVANGTGFTLTLNGSGFTPNTTVSFGGTNLSPTVSSSTQLTVSIPGNLVASAPADGAVRVTASNPSPGGGTSAELVFGLATATSTLSANVQPIFTASCASSGCHSNASGNVPMTLVSGQSYGNTVGVASSQCGQRLRVQACGPLPSQSYLMAKLLGTDLCSGTRMPKSGPLTATELRIIRDWIAQGAPQ